MIRYFLNGGFFYIGFFVAAIGAAKGLFWWGPVFFTAILTIHLFFYGNPRHEFIFVIIFCCVGFAAESLLLRTKILTYPGSNGYFPPFWLLSIYGMYAMTIDHSLRWLRNHKTAAIPLGMIGGSFSYLAGARMGALTITAPISVFLLGTALLWGVLSPLSFFLRQKIGSKPK